MLGVCEAKDVAQYKTNIHKIRSGVFRNSNNLFSLYVSWSYGQGQNYELWGWYVLQSLLSAPSLSLWLFLASALVYPLSCKFPKSRQKIRSGVDRRWKPSASIYVLLVGFPWILGMPHCDVIYVLFTWFTMENMRRYNGALCILLMNH